MINSLCNIFGLMFINSLVVNRSLIKLDQLKANAVSQPTLEPHSLCYACGVQVDVLTLASLQFSLLGDTSNCCSVPGDVEDYVQDFDEF